MRGWAPWLAAVVAIVVIVGAYVSWDLLRGRSQEIICDDGPRRTIDLRDFATQYSSYTVQLEVTLPKKVRVRGELDPKALQQLSEALQQSNEFRKFVVAGYNACAVSRAEYGQYGARFQALEALARQVSDGMSQIDKNPAVGAALGPLITQYVELSRKAVEK